MDFMAAKDLILIGLLTIGVGLLGWMAKSVSALNTKIAVVIFQLGTHDERIKKLEDRI